jgi:pantoate--beta-alanine ligase
MLPTILTTIAEVRAAVAEARKQGRTIGLVPTMGALHAGHASLIRAARTEKDFIVVSIFVNPTQFAPTEDLDRYPRTLEADRQLCGAVGTDIIFLPSPQEIYPEGFRTYVEVTELQKVLCGVTRPDHFRGVATVVLKLFNIVGADRAYFGQKDAQQALIIRRMVRDLDVPIDVRIQPTIRESDGLAMSSRNRYLSPVDRQHATVLYKALEQIKQQVAGGERSVAILEKTMTNLIAQTPGARLDYAQIRDTETLESLETLDRPTLAALAVYFGTTRLIDNTLLTP